MTDAGLGEQMVNAAVGILIRGASESIEANKTLDELVRERDPALAKAADDAFGEARAATEEVERMQTEVESAKKRRDEVEDRAFVLHTKAAQLFAQQKSIARELMGWRS